MVAEERLNPSPFTVLFVGGGVEEPLSVPSGSPQVTVVREEVIVGGRGEVVVGW